VQKPCGGQVWQCTAKGFADSSACRHAGLLYFTEGFVEAGAPVVTCGLVHVGRKVPRWVRAMVALSHPGLQVDGEAVGHLTAVAARFLDGGAHSYVGMGCSGARGVWHVRSVHVAEAVGHAAIRRLSGFAGPWAHHTETYVGRAGPSTDVEVPSPGAMYGAWCNAIRPFVLAEYGSMTVPARTLAQWEAHLREQTLRAVLG